MRIRVHSLLEVEDLIDNRLDLRIEQSVKVLELLDGTDHDTTHIRGVHHDGANETSGVGTLRGQGPDYAHRTTDPDGVDRLDERSRAADFDDMLNA